MLKKFNEHYPVLAEDVFVAPGAYIIGNVEIGDKSSVWFSAVIRGDTDKITIGEETNIQDNCTVHTDAGAPVNIGSRVTVGHNAVIHGCTIEDDVLIGIGAVIMNGACVRRGSVVGSGAVVTAGTEIPPDSLALGSPAKKVKEVTPDIAAGRDMNVQGYQQLADMHRQQE